MGLARCADYVLDNWREKSIKVDNPTVDGLSI